MPISREMHWVDPKSITIDRDSRQRRKIDIGDLIPSIRAKGIMNPILVEDNMKLRAGERRLTTGLFLEMAEVPIRFVSEMSELELQLLELDENLKREDLPWQDQATTFVRVHQGYVELNGEDWTTEQTAIQTGYHERHVYKMIDLGEAILEGDQSVIQAETIANATTILARRRQRQTGEALNRILEIEDEPPVAKAPASAELPAGGVGNVVEHTSGNSTGTSAPVGRTEAVPAKPAAPNFAIANADMHEFLSNYSGPKFNFLHCDLPYGVALNGQAGQEAFEGGGYESTPDIYWSMCTTLIRNWGKFMYPSAHVMFWISMKFYTETVHLFEEAASDGVIPSDLKINPTPLVWMKTDNKGILADPMRMPRNIYEAALVMSTGDRFLVKPASNAYGCPTSKATSIHTNEKPEPMLKHFMGMFVDGHSRVFDPTCGSGSSIRAAEALGAEAGLGLEFNPEFAERANSALIQARNLRNLSGLISEAASTLDSNAAE